MRWGRRWPERVPRPKARRLAEVEKDRILATLERGIAASPVLTAFGIQARVQRGRFYVERQRQEKDFEPYTEVWGRITPLTGAKKELLLEAERANGRWFEVARGLAGRLIKAIADDRKGTFHGLGALDKSLRRSGKGLNRLSVRRRGNARFFYVDTGEQCTAQEALFHYFGLSVEVIAQPRQWYWYHRMPIIVEAAKDRTRVLVQFTTATMLGDTFGGTCLYIRRDGEWGAYRIRPSESESIFRAEAWLVKRKWRAWSW